MAYSPLTTSAEGAFTFWICFYRQNNLDGSHPLDYKMDRNKDYSPYVAITEEEHRNRVQAMTQAEVEAFAEKNFFAKLPVCRSLRKQHQPV